MQSRSVEFAKKFGVVFEVRSSFNDNPGTIVKEETKSMEAVVVRGVSIEKNQAKVTVRAVPDRPGVAARVFTAVAAAQIVIDMIVQNVAHDGTTDISFTLNKDELPKVEAGLARSREGNRRARTRDRKRLRQAERHRRRHAQPQRRRGEDVRGAQQRRHQHRDDQHLGDQNRRHHRRGKARPKARTSCTRRSGSGSRAVCTRPAQTLRATSARRSVRDEMALK